MFVTGALSVIAVPATQGSEAAAASERYCAMSISSSPYGSSYRRISVNCAFNYSGYFIYRGIFYGADPASDDRLFEYHPKSKSLAFTYDVSKTALNEDWGGDEVYATVELHGPGGYMDLKTNVVSGDW